MTMTQTHSNEDKIRAVAYALWLDEGRPDGRADAHWLKALAIVNAEAVEAAPARPKKAVAARKSAPRKRS